MSHDGDWLKIVKIPRLNNDSVCPECKVQVESCYCDDCEMGVYHCPTCRIIFSDGGESRVPIPEPAGPPIADELNGFLKSQPGVDAVKKVLIKEAVRVKVDQITEKARDMDVLYKEARTQGLIPERVLRPGVSCAVCGNPIAYQDKMCPVCGHDVREVL